MKKRNMPGDINERGPYKKALISCLLITIFFAVLFVSCQVTGSGDDDPTAYAILTGDFGTFDLEDWILFRYGIMNARINGRISDHTVDQNITGTFYISGTNFTFHFSDTLKDVNTEETNTFVLGCTDGILGDTAGNGTYTADFGTWTDIGSTVWDATKDS